MHFVPLIRTAHGLSCLELLLFVRLLFSLSHPYGAAVPYPWYCAQSFMSFDNPQIRVHRGDETPAVHLDLAHSQHSTIPCVPRRISFGLLAREYLPATFGAVPTLM